VVYLWLSRSPLVYPLIHPPANYRSQRALRAKPFARSFSTHLNDMLNHSVSVTGGSITGSRPSSSSRTKKRDEISSISDYDRTAFPLFVSSAHVSGAEPVSFASQIFSVNASRTLSTNETIDSGANFQGRVTRSQSSSGPAGAPR